MFRDKPNNPAPSIESLVFNTLFTGSPIALYWVDRYGYILGANDTQLKILKLPSTTCLIGKHSADIANLEAWENSKRIMDQDFCEIIEEEYVQADGEKSYLLSIKKPYHDKLGKVAGLIGISIDITKQKQAEKKINTSVRELTALRRAQEVAFDTFFEHLPVNCYRIDNNGYIIWSNKNQLHEFGRHNIEEVKGKHVSEEGDLPSWLVSKTIMESKKANIVEELHEKRDTGEKVTFLSVKSPILDEQENVLGLIGISINTTDRKKSELLQLENEAQKTQLQEQEKFKKIVSQVVHDIRSPTASLLMILHACEKDIPEVARVALREAATSICDIANNLLSKYKREDVKSSIQTEVRQPVIVSLILLQILTDKKYQYHDSLIKFEHDFSPNCSIASFNITPIAFKRMMSNLINNALDAYEGKKGTVRIKLDVDGDQIKITIQDSGKGMPPEIIDQIMHQIAVTSDKKEGHGIGFIQIQDTLKRNQGILAIESAIGKGTKIMLTFPRAESAVWLAKNIELSKGDTVVIIDDDPSIHGAWQARFKAYAQDLDLQHFSEGKKSIDFISTFPEKDKLFLLTDFELLGQNLNGLHIIAQTNIQRSILVTSHYADPTVQSLATKSGTKILPKQLASEVPITINLISAVN